MAKSKKVIKEFVLDSDTDSAVSNVKAEPAEMPKMDEKVFVDNTPPVSDEPKEKLSFEPEICGTGAPKLPKEKKQQEKKPRKSKKQKTEEILICELKEPAEVPAVKEPKKAKELKVKIQKPKALTEAQIRAKIEKEYAEKENMKVKIRRELEEEYERKHKNREKRHPEPESESEDLGETDDYEEEDLESEMDFGQAQIERGNRKAIRAPKSVDLMYKQIFG